MKKVFFTLLVFAASAVAYSQNAKAIITSGSTAQIVDFNPATAVRTNANYVGVIEAPPRDFIFDAKNGHAIYQDKNTGLVFCNISGNQITTKNFNMMSTVMAPAYVPSSEEILCFNVKREFNGYGSNEENLFFSKINVNKGFTENLIKFSDLSFDNVAAPFFGKVTVRDRFTNKEIQKEVAISKPLYIAEKDLYMVLIRDVTGTNRLYKIRVNSKNANVASTRCEYNIIDMVHVIGTDITKALYFEKTGNLTTFMVGDFNIVTNKMSNVSVVKTSNISEVNNGSIKFNNQQTELYVSHFEGNNTNIYNLNIDNNQNNSNVAYSGYVQYDFGFNETYYKSQSYNNTFGLYPNPSNGMVYFKNNSGIVPNSIKVYDNVGQLVRSIMVEELAVQIPIDLSDMAAGIYHVKIDMMGKDFTGKVAISK